MCHGLVWSIFPEAPEMTEENHERPEGGWYMNRNLLGRLPERERAALVLEAAWSACVVMHPALQVAMLWTWFTCSEASFVNSCVPAWFYY